MICPLGINIYPKHAFAFLSQNSSAGLPTHGSTNALSIDIVSHKMLYPSNALIWWWRRYGKGLSCYPKADDLIDCWNGLMKKVPYKKVLSSSVCMGPRTKRNESGLSKVWCYHYLDICILWRDVLSEKRVLVQLNPGAEPIPQPFLGSSYQWTNKRGVECTVLAGGVDTGIL